METPELLREMLELEEKLAWTKKTEDGLRKRRDQVEMRLSHILESMGIPSAKVVHGTVNEALAEWLGELTDLAVDKAKDNPGSVERNVGMRSTHWANIEKDFEVHQVPGDSGALVQRIIEGFEELGYGEKIVPTILPQTLSAVVRECIKDAEERGEIAPGDDPVLALPEGLRNLVSIARRDKLTVTKTSSQSMTSKSMAARQGHAG